MTCTCDYGTWVGDNFANTHRNDCPANGLEEAVREALSHLDHITDGNAPYNPDALAASAILRRALDGCTEKDFYCPGPASPTTAHQGPAPGCPECSDGAA